MEKQEGMVEVPKREVLKRNNAAENVVDLSITLPPADISYLKRWSRSEKITLSRAIHEAIVAYKKNHYYD